MSTRKQKTIQRKSKRIEDRECLLILKQRLAEIGTDPSKWELIDSEEIFKKYRETQE